MDGEKLIEKKLNALLTNGSGDRAERLVLTSHDGKNLGGWGRLSLRDHLLEMYEAGQRAERERIADRIEDVMYVARSTGEFVVALRSLMRELRADPAESGE